MAGFKNKTFLNNNPPQLEDDDLNGYTAEFENVITSTAQTPDNLILDQTAKGISTYAARGDFYTDSGAADAYVLSAVGTQLPPIVYATGMRVRFVPANNNTGASTINVATLGVKNIKNRDGTDPVLDQIESGILIEIYYDGTDFIIVSSIPEDQILDRLRIFLDDTVVYNTATYQTAMLVQTGNGVDFKTWEKFLLGPGKVELRVTASGTVNIDKTLAIRITRAATVEFEELAVVFGSSGIELTIIKSVPS